MEINFEVNIDMLENFTAEAQEFMKKGNIQKKTIKIDLDDISSGGEDDNEQGDDTSSEESSQNDNLYAE